MPQISEIDRLKNSIVLQATTVINLRDSVGGIPASINNSSELQRLSILLQHLEAAEVRELQSAFK